LRTQEIISIQHPLNSKEVPSNDDSQVEVGKAVGTRTTCSNVEIEINMQALKISADIEEEKAKGNKP